MTEVLETAQSALSFGPKIIALIAVLVVVLLAIGLIHLIIEQNKK